MRGEEVSVCAGKELAAGNFRIGRRIQDQACAQPFRSRSSSGLSRASLLRSLVHAFLQLPNPCSCLKDILFGSESSHANFTLIIPVFLILPSHFSPKSENRIRWVSSASPSPSSRLSPPSIAVTTITPLPISTIRHILLRYPRRTYIHLIPTTHRDCHVRSTMSVPSAGQPADP